MNPIDVKHRRLGEAACSQSNSKEAAMRISVRDKIRLTPNQLCSMLRHCTCGMLWSTVGSIQEKRRYRRFLQSRRGDQSCHLLCSLPCSYPGLQCRSMVDRLVPIVFIMGESKSVKTAKYGKTHRELARYRTVSDVASEFLITGLVDLRLGRRISLYSNGLWESVSVGATYRKEERMTPLVPRTCINSS